MAVWLLPPGSGLQHQPVQQETEVELCLLRLRNEPDLWGKGSAFSGLGRWQRLGTGGTQTFELAERTLVRALGRVDAALETNEGAIAAGEGVAEGRVLVEGKSRIHLVFPNLGVGFGEAAELPVVTDEGIDIEALFGGGGAEAFEIFGGGDEGTAVTDSDLEIRSDAQL